MRLLVWNVRFDTETFYARAKPRLQSLPGDVVYLRLHDFRLWLSWSSSEDGDFSKDINVSDTFRHFKTTLTT
jgi:hypothetical protein